MRREGTLDQSLKDFVSEAEDILENLDEAISTLSDLDPEDYRKPDILNAVFRHAHSLKGLSGMFNLDNLSTLSHRLENLLDAMRLGKVDFSEEVVDILGQGVQKLARMVRAVGDGLPDSSVEFSGFLDDLEKVVKGERDRDEMDLSFFLDVPQGLTEMLSEYEEHRFRDSISKGIPFYRVTRSFPLETFDVQLEKIGSGIKEIGELLTTLPETDLGDGGNIGFTLYFTTRSKREEILEKLDLSEQSLESVRYLKEKKPGLKSPAPAEMSPKTDDRQSFEEEIKGSIEAGKLADLVILAQDPTKVQPELIKDTQVDMTIVGGKMVFCGE